MKTFIFCLLLLVGGLSYAQEEGEYTDEDTEEVIDNNEGTTWYCDTTDCSDLYDLCDCYVNNNGDEVCSCE